MIDKKKYMKKNKYNAVLNDWNSLRRLKIARNDGKEVKFSSDHLMVLSCVFGLCWNGGESPVDDRIKGFEECCWASNDSLAGFLYMTTGHVRDIIRDLITIGFIDHAEEIVSNGTRRWLKPNIRNIEDNCEHNDIKQSAIRERERQKSVKGTGRKQTKGVENSAPKGVEMSNEFDEKSTPQGVENSSEGCREVGTNDTNMTLIRDEEKIYFSHLNKLDSKNIFSASNSDIKSNSQRSELFFGCSADEYDEITELFG